MLAVYKTFSRGFDWEKGEIHPEEKTRIMAEGRAALYGSNRKARRLLSQLEAKRRSVVLRLEQSGDTRIRPGENILAPCDAETSCRSNACPICRIVLHKSFERRLRLVCECHPVMRASVSLDNGPHRPPHVELFQHAYLVRSKMRHTLSALNIDDHPWLGIIEESAELCEDTVGAVYFAEVYLFGYGASTNYDTSLHYNRDDADIDVDAILQDVQELIEDGGEILRPSEAVEVDFRVHRGNFDEQVVEAIETDVAIARSLEDVFHSVFLLGPGSRETDSALK